MSVRKTASSLGSVFFPSLSPFLSVISGFPPCIPTYLGTDIHRKVEVTYIAKVTTAVVSLSVPLGSLLGFGAPRMNGNQE